MTLLLGIDLGSTTCRAVVFDPDGNEVAAAYGETTLRYPRPRWAEGDPEEWWRCAASIVREALTQVGADNVAGVATSALMHAPVLLDGDGRPVAPSPLWMDQRCAPQAAAIGIATTLTAPKLRWLAEREPETLARARMLMLPKDFLRYRLTGVAGTDPSDAGGTGLFDRDAEVFRQDLVEKAMLPRELVPKLTPSHERAGGVSAEAAALTGLREGTPVAMGGSDVYCARLGAGPLEGGEALLYMGTAAWIAFTGAGPDGKPRTRGFGSTATTGAALRWTRDLLGMSYDELTDAAAEVAPGAEGLYFLPHLSGERGPEPDPLARGALVGMTLRHGRGHAARAVLEGTAFQIRRLLDVRAPAPVVRTVVCGGAAKSDLWMRILSDVARTPLRLPANVETSAVGAAMLAGVAAGLFTLEEATARMVRPGATYEPEPDTAARYDAVYARYCKLDGLLMPFFHEEDDR